jgi:hypothetical protein
LDVIAGSTPSDATGTPAMGVPTAPSNGLTVGMMSTRRHGAER